MGQFSPDQVRAGFEGGSFLATDLAWQPGMETWQALGSVVDGIAPGHNVDGTAQKIAAGGGLSWEQRSDIGVVRSLLLTIRSLLLKPTPTFSAMRTDGSYLEPLLFLMLAATAFSLGGYGLLFTVSKIGVLGDLTMRRILEFAVSSLPSLAWWAAVLSGLFAVFAIVSTAATHFALIILRGAKNSLRATFRVTCYSIGASSALLFFPLCGGVIAFVWNVVLGIIGLSETHKISHLRAAAAVLMPYVGCFTLLVVWIAVKIDEMPNVTLRNPSSTEIDERGNHRRIHEYFDEKDWDSEPAFKSTDDDIMAYWLLQSQRFTYDHDKARSDDVTWQSVPLTWQIERGVCRDSATLLADMLCARNYDARLVVGYVVDGFSLGGHAWVVLRDGSSGDEYLLESTAETLDLPLRYPPRTFTAPEYLPEMQVTGDTYFVPADGKVDDPTNYTFGWNKVPADQ